MGCNDSGVIRVSYKGVVQFDDYVTLEEARNHLVSDGIHITAEHITGNISRVICEQIKGMDWALFRHPPSYGSYETKMYNYPVFSPTGTTLENGDKRQGINWEMDFRLAHKRIRRAEVVAENRKSITKLETKHSTILKDIRKDNSAIRKENTALQERITQNEENLNQMQEKLNFLLPGTVVRRMLDSIPPRTHSSRCDSPVMLRLLQEIEAAQEKCFRF